MTVVVAIAGGSGSGKTELASALHRVLGTRALVLRHDDYYHPLPEHLRATPEAHNFDHPDALETALLALHLRHLRAGVPVDVPRYDFARHARVGVERVTPRPCVIVEGILVLAHPDVRDVADLTVFVHAPEPVRLERRLARDVATRGRRPEWVRDRFARHVAPMHAAHVEPTRALADVVVDGTAPLDASVATTLAALRARGAPVD